MPLSKIVAASKVISSPSKASSSGTNASVPKIVALPPIPKPTVVTPSLTQAPSSVTTLKSLREFRRPKASPEKVAPVVPPVTVAPSPPSVDSSEVEVMSNSNSVPDPLDDDSLDVPDEGPYYPFEEEYQAQLKEARKSRCVVKVERINLSAYVHKYNLSTTTMAEGMVTLAVSFFSFSPTLIQDGVK